MNPDSLPNGGPAFPCTHQNQMNGQPTEEMSGMSLRDHFAGLALQAQLTAFWALETHHGWSDDAIAREAYSKADAMIKAREAKS